LRQRSQNRSRQQHCLRLQSLRRRLPKKPLSRQWLPSRESSRGCFKLRRSLGPHRRRRRLRRAPIFRSHPSRQRRQNHSRRQHWLPLHSLRRPLRHRLPRRLFRRRLLPNRESSRGCFKLRRSLRLLRRLRRAPTYRSRPSLQSNQNRSRRLQRLPHRRLPQRLFRRQPLLNRENSRGCFKLRRFLRPPRRRQRLRRRSISRSHPSRQRRRERKRQPQRLLLHSRLHRLPQRLLRRPPNRRRASSRDCLRCQCHRLQRRRAPPLRLRRLRQRCPSLENSRDCFKRRPRRWPSQRRLRRRALPVPPKTSRGCFINLPCRPRRHRGIGRLQRRLQRRPANSLACFSRRRPRRRRRAIRKEANSHGSSRPRLREPRDLPCRQRPGSRPRRDRRRLRHPRRGTPHRLARPRRLRFRPCRSRGRCRAHRKVPASTPA